MNVKTIDRTTSSVFCWLILILYFVLSIKSTDMFQSSSFLKQRSYTVAKKFLKERPCLRKNLHKEKPHMRFEITFDGC